MIALAVTEFAGVTHLFRQQATTDPDRKAAEYVLSIGGQVQVDDRDRNINAAAELPRDPFRLTWVGLKDSNQVSDAGLANFKECKNLTFLGLFDTSVSDEGLANFQNCTKLTFLNLSRTKISDAGLANFKNCTELATVVLNETKVSDAGLDYLKNSKNLTKLFLQKTKVTAAGIEELKKASPLCKIEWDSGVIEDALPPTFTNSIGMEFVIVPKGKSWLGGGKDKLGDKEVEIPADFYLGKYEVTQEEWEKVMGENPSHFSRTGERQGRGEGHPGCGPEAIPGGERVVGSMPGLCGEAEQAGEGDGLGLSVADGGGMGVRLSGRPDGGQAGQRLRLLLRQADEHPVAGTGELQTTD